jgi:hypothetical protein
MCHEIDFIWHRFALARKSRLRELAHLWMSGRQVSGGQGGFGSGG